MKVFNRASRSVRRSIKGGLDALGSGFSTVGKTVSGGIKSARKAVGLQKMRQQPRRQKPRRQQPRNVNRSVKRQSPSRSPKKKILKISRSSSPSRSRSRSSSPSRSSIKRSPLTPSRKRGKKVNSPWIDHVKRYARTHNVSYGEAMSAAGTSYRN